MENLFEYIFESPGSIVFIALFVVLIVMSIASKKANSQAKQGANTAYDNIGDADKTKVISGYYRYQEDNQIVIERTEEQQKIFEEYFVVQNIKTTICKSELKKKAKKLKTLSTVLLWIGILVLVIGIIASEIAVSVIGGVSIVAAIICKSVSNNLMEQFKRSIKISYAPNKVMTDEEYEKLVDEKIESMNIEQMGLDRLGIDPEQIKEIRPIVLRNKVINDYSLRVKNYQDNTIHSSTQHVTYLYFTDEQLFVYKIVFDMCCNMQDEWAKEFFYKDICDISTHTQRNVLNDGEMKFEYSTVSFDIIVTNSEIGFVLDGDNENINSLMAMKQKIREKK